MLRYVYFLCLLICIEWSFCYDYNEYTNGVNYNVAGRIGKGNNRFGNAKSRRQHKLHRDEIFDTKNPVAQFDVSSFIKNNEEDTYEEENKQRTSNNDYGAYTDLNNNNIKKQDKGTDYLNLAADNAYKLNMNPPLSKDTINRRHSKMNALSLDEKFVRTHGDEAKHMYQYMIDENINRKPEKKCAFKHLKFPFFSHTKPVTKTKKAKKRKVFCVNCAKKEEANDIPQSNHYNMDGYKVNKRSYEETLCPECKRKFILNDRLKHSAKGIIHNSRQFFQNVKDLAKHKSKDSKHPANKDTKTDNHEIVDSSLNDNRNSAKEDKTDKYIRVKDHNNFDEVD